MNKINTSVIIDGLLRIAAFGALTSAALLAPASLSALDKPLRKQLDKLDERARKREISKAMSYIRYRKLITQDYQHGIILTEKAKRRLARNKINSLEIPRSTIWDEKWRIVFFDIPEKQKTKRDAFAGHLRRMGFAVLQRSVFVSPFPSRDEIALLSAYCEINQFVTYIEASHIDNEALLRKYFDI